MQNDHPAHLDRVQSYTTASYLCSYLPQHQARSLVAVVEPEFAQAKYDALVAQGFRRSGLYMYRPQCDACQACVPVRLVADDFAPSRSQRRAALAHADLVVNILPLQLYGDHLALYLLYQSKRHAEDEAHVNKDQDELSFTQFLLRSQVSTRLVEFRTPDGRLVAVSVVDWLKDGLSAVYTFFDPDAAGSFGTYAVLWMINQAKLLQLPYVYLGYWIAQSAKMAYKANFKPLQYYQGEQWQWT